MHTICAAGRPDASVVIPAFNAARTIDATLASARGQSVGDIEIIVVDDSSTDATVDLVRELAAEDRRIRLIEQVNSGPSTARNRGVDAARSPVVAFLDADDVWTSEHLQLHLGALAADPRLGVSFSACAIVDHQLRPTGEVTRPPAHAIRCEDVLGGNPAGTCSSLVVRRQTFDDAGPMRSDMAFAEDQEWLFRATRSGWAVRGLDRRTVLYRTSPGGLSANVERMRAGWLAFMARARELEPALVEAHEKRAVARMNLYWARRAVKAGKPATACASYLAAAIKASPGIVAASPFRILEVAGGCIAPRLTESAITAARSLRHD